VSFIKHLVSLGYVAHLHKSSSLLLKARIVLMLKIVSHDSFGVLSYLCTYK